MGEAHGTRVRHWFKDKKAGWYAVLEDPQMPAMNAVFDEAHDAIDRKLLRHERNPPVPTVPEGVDRYYSPASPTSTT